MKRRYLALCGGVGGAKLAFGLSRLLAPNALTVVVNTADDFTHLGLRISPDIDTVAYTLANLADRERGWGLAGETWKFMAALRQLGGEDWFQLGDGDLAMHVERTRRLAEGQSLSEVTWSLTRALGIDHAIVPMSDDPIATRVLTDGGELDFQRYFVGARCEPVVRGIRFEGVEGASASPGFRAALEATDLGGVIICPSNPYLSIDPILATPAVADMIRGLRAPVVALSPIVGAEAIKGPTAKIMREMGIAPSAASIAYHYGDLIDGLIIDEANADEREEIPYQSVFIGTREMTGADIKRGQELWAELNAVSA